MYIVCSGKDSGCAFKERQSCRISGLATQEAMRVLRSHVRGPRIQLVGRKASLVQKSPRSQ